MNQDFLLNASPANARRLLRLASGDERIKLPSELASIAARDQVDANSFDSFICPYTDERRAITQFLLDCDLRAVVLSPYHPAFGEIALLNAVRMSSYRPITIASYRRSAWRLPLKLNYLADDTLLVGAHELTNPQIDARRHGLLVIDMHTIDLTRSSCSTRLLHEFPRTILYSHGESLDGLKHWTSMASALLPSMPHPLAIRAVLSNPAGWSDKPISYFAQYYNVCLFPEFIASREVLAHANTMDMNDTSM